MKKSLFYTNTREISGGSRKQASRAGADYIKVNVHQDNYDTVEKITDTVAPASDATNHCDYNCISKNQLYLLFYLILMCTMF